MKRTWICGLLLSVLGGGPALAQAPATLEGQPAQAAGAQAPDGDADRPTLPTVVGDRGFWYVPTADVSPRGRGWITVLRSNYGRQQGLTDIGIWGLTGSFGVTDRLELFGNWRVVGLDRDVRPIFFSDPDDAELGGLTLDFPFDRRGWSKWLGGPLTLGAKYNLLSQSRGAGMSLAPRVVVSLPPGSDWATSDAVTTRVELVGSGEVNQRIEISAFGGGVFRSNPDPFELSNGASWGLGASFPSRAPLRGLAEVTGEFVFDDVRVRGVYFGDDGSVAPSVTPVSSPVDLKLGAVWQPSRNFFLHGGVNYSVGAEGEQPGIREVTHNAWGAEFRVGVWPVFRRAAPPPPPPAPPAPPPPAPTPTPAPPPPNRNPSFSVAATCNPMTVLVGEMSNCTATAIDPDGDPVTYLWTAPQGMLGAPNAQNTPWTAPGQPGTVPITVTARDNRGGQAASTVNVQVIQRTVIVFEDVHFDFDRSVIRPDGAKILDEAIATLQKNPDIRVTIEGHTDSIGTLEYNLALGERRAAAVRDYLTTRGIAADRLRTVSYGEERPETTNATAEGRAINRRAHIVVIMEQ